MTLNLVQEMVFVVSPIREVVPPLFEQLTHECDDQTPFDPLTFYTALTISDTRPATSDVQVEVTAKANFDGENRVLLVFLNATGEGEEIAVFFANSGKDCVEQGEAITVPKALWNERFIGEGADLIKVAGSHLAGCSGQFYRITITYSVATGAVAEDNPAAVEVVTAHDTLVTGPNEEHGVPHVHHAEVMHIPHLGWKLGVVSQTDDGEITISGLSAAPGDENGDWIPTRGFPGTLESRSSGKLAATWVGFSSIGNCPEY